MNKNWQHWHSQALYQNRRKNLWKTRFYGAAFGAAFFAFMSAVLICLLASRGSSCPTEYAFQPATTKTPLTGEMPDCTMATLIMYNIAHEGHPKEACWCSATTFADDGTYGYCVGCGHCFTGNVGGKFWCYRPDGQKVMATFLAKEHSTEGDLSLFRIDHDDVLAVAPLWDGKSEGSIDIIGYPCGKGPTWIKAGQGKVLSCGQVMHQVLHGDRVQPGNSGSGIFCDGMLCGVISGYCSVHGGGEARAGCTFTHLVAFLNRHKAQMEVKDVPGQDDPGYQPPKWGPTPSGTLPICKPKKPRPNKQEAMQELQQLKDAISQIQKQISGLPSGSQGPPGPIGPAGPVGPPGGDGNIDKGTLNDLEIADQRNANDISTLQNNLALLKQELAAVEQRLSNAEVKNINQDGSLQSLTNRVGVVEQNLSGSFRFTVRRDTTGNVSLNPSQTPPKGK